MTITSVEPIWFELQCYRVFWCFIYVKQTSMSMPLNSVEPIWFALQCRRVYTITTLLLNVNADHFRGTNTVCTWMLPCTSKLNLTPLFLCYRYSICKTCNYFHGTTMVCTSVFFFVTAVDFLFNRIFYLEMSVVIVQSEFVAIRRTEIPLFLLLTRRTGNRKHLYNSIVVWRTEFTTSQ